MDAFKRLRGQAGVYGVLAFSLGGAAGVMICISVVDLWFPLMVREGVVVPSLFVLAGFALFYLSSKAMARCDRFKPEAGALPLSKHDHVHASQLRNFRVSAMMFFALTLHNFPEGLAVSVSAASSDKLGFTIAIAVALHNFPEGAIIAAPCYHASKNRSLAIGLAFLSGLSEPFGALASTIFLGPFLKTHPGFVPYVLCIVAGIMLAASFLELLPEASLYNRSGTVATGFISGTVIMLVTIWAIE